MKELMRKLSMILVAAMVITMIPVTSIKGDTKITLGVSKEEAAKTQEFTLDLNESQKWGFYGATGYTAADAKTKKWTSSNPAVVEVVNGQITAKSVGSANIALTVTTNGVTYAGSAKVTVKAADAADLAQDFGDFSIVQTAWNAVTVTFADNETAEAAKKAGIKVERVKESSKLATPYYLTVKTTATVADDKVIISGVNEGNTYRFTVPGSDEQPVITMHVGEPAALTLTYGKAEMGENKDILGNSIKKPGVTPEVKVVDENGIQCNYTTKNYTKFTATDKKGCNFTGATGKIVFNDINGSVKVKATITVKNSKGEQVTLSTETTVAPTRYEAPGLQGFVEQICLTDNKKGDKIVYPTDYSFEAEMKVGQKD